MSAISSARHHVAGTAKRFARANGGNIAVIFAFSLLPILAFIGAAIDYSRANKARAAMQAALDSAALMVSKDLSSGIITTADVPKKAQDYFNGLYTYKSAQVTAINATYTNGSDSVGSTLLLQASGQIETDIMKVVGFPTMSFGSNSTATWGNVRLRVALVLDVTGSMDSDNKMPNLQGAANSMIDALGKLGKNTGDVYISVVPFAKDVNVGLVNPAPTWTTGWDAWKAEPAAIVPPATKIAHWANYGPGAPCPFTGQQFGCASTPTSGSATTSTIPSSGNYSGYICPGLDSGTSNYYNGCYDSHDLGNSSNVTLCTGSDCKCSEVAIGGTGSGACSCTGHGSNKSCSQSLRNYSHTWIPNDKTTWNGCVTDRDQNNDISNDPPKLGDASTQFYVEQWSGCPSVPIKAMTDQWSSLKKDVINKLAPAGNTNQAIGLAWGWLTLGKQIPELKAPDKDDKYVYQDYVVLVSDGLNTQDRWYTNAGSIDTRQAALCDKMKRAPSNVTIFTIQINTGTGKNKDPESAVLKGCASSGNFQMITTAGETASAFQNITTKISQLRLAK
jgi:Flp pilus assembly protein TadG